MNALSAVAGVGLGLALLAGGTVAQSSVGLNAGTHPAYVDDQIPMSKQFAQRWGPRNSCPGCKKEGRDI
jgi:hypothetical protein